MSYWFTGLTGLTDTLTVRNPGQDASGENGTYGHLNL